MTVLHSNDDLMISINERGDVFVQMNKDIVVKSKVVDDRNCGVKIMVRGDKIHIQPMLDCKWDGCIVDDRSLLNVLRQEDK